MPPAPNRSDLVFERATGASAAASLPSFAPFWSLLSFFSAMGSPALSGITTGFDQTGVDAAVLAGRRGVLERPGARLDALGHEAVPLDEVAFHALGARDREPRVRRLELLGGVQRAALEQQHLSEARPQGLRDRVQVLLDVAGQRR